MCASISFSLFLAYLLYMFGLRRLLLQIYQATFIAVYFKLMVAYLLTHSKLTVVFHSPSLCSCFLSLYFTSWVCRLSYCCDYTRSSYSRTPNSVLAFVLGDTLLLSCVCLCQWDCCSLWGIRIFHIDFLLLKEVSLTFLMVKNYFRFFLVRESLYLSFHSKW